ncbi:hypothetical protein [Flammeovirga sp. SJP92]|uniref:hypothetical protein n=1 Tax=Flammeovirga sp. SJP92 TaxID=1775430 RepID=UPI000786AE5B|nr:hypothetical protein [Flammeovirga sp. SJP92]KXX68625.1 hypothetical protein AVL50_22980 [Flammeovirga sp. SJP92]
MNTSIQNSISSLPFDSKDLPNRIDDVLLENEITFAEKFEVISGVKNELFDIVKGVEEISLKIITRHVFNKMRYQKISEVQKDTVLTERQKELKLQESLLDIYLLQNEIEEMIQEDLIQIEKINVDTQEYLTSTFRLGEEFLSKMNNKVSSMIR